MNIKHVRPTIVAPRLKKKGACRFFATSALVVSAAFAGRPAAAQPLDRPSSAAEAQAIRFDIAPGPLDTALRQFETVTGLDLEVRLPPDTTSSIKSPGVSGVRAWPTALQELLAGTSLAEAHRADPRHPADDHRDFEPGHRGAGRHHPAGRAAQRRRHHLSGRRRRRAGRRHADDARLQRAHRHVRGRRTRRERLRARRVQPRAGGSGQGADVGAGRPRFDGRRDQPGEQGAVTLQHNGLFITAALPLHVFPPLFNRYTSGQSFGNHVDNAIRQVPGTAHRLRTDLSCTLFFSQPDEYDGGELVVEDTWGAQRQAGGGRLVLYPATSLHHVRPVTRGARVCAFFWLQSMGRSDADRTLLFDLDAAIRGLHGVDAVADQAVQLTGVYHNLLRRWSEV